MRVREVVLDVIGFLADEGTILLGPSGVQGIAQSYFDARGRGLGDRHIHDEDAEALGAEERPQTIWKQQQPIAVPQAEDVMSAAAQELLRIVRGEVKANRYADDDSPVSPSFDERIRAAECLLGNRTELDVKGLDAIAHRVAGSTGPR